MKGIVSNEIALILKKKEFKEPCIACYDGCDMLATYSTVFKPLNYNTGGNTQKSAPFYDDVQDWLEKVHGLGIETALDETLSWVWRITPLHPQATYQQQINSQNVYCKGRKEALVAAIEETLKHI